MKTKLRITPVYEPNGMGNGWEPCLERDATAYEVGNDIEVVESFETRAKAEAYIAKYGAEYLADLRVERTPIAIKKTVWLGTMELFGYTLHVVSETRRGIQTALLTEYMRHPQRELKNPTFAQLAEQVEIHIQQMPFDTVVWP